ncbi:MAG: hypothetical protein IJX81_03060 [Clostridia bacterium]|nr:hypothetical protein [Clostridia bacterium]
MDMMQKLPVLPESDYKNGKLKKLRGRMLKKLLKYEFRYLLPAICIGIGILLFSSILLAVQIGALANTSTPLFVTSIILYAYANIGVLILVFALAERRFYNNFFKNEGALTFSIPATAEEHIFAKHLSALVCALLTFAAIALGLIILGVGIGEPFFKIFGELFADLNVAMGELFLESPVNVTLFTVEGILYLLESFLVVPCVIGALTVFLRRFTGKKKSLVVFLMILGIGGVSNFFSTAFLVSGLPKVVFSSLVGIHIAIWVALLLNAALIWFCLFYEIYVLKKKLDI